MSTFEVSRFVAPDVWAEIVRGGITPENPQVAFVSTFIAMVMQRLPDAITDVYRSADPDLPPGSGEIVIRVQTAIPDTNTRHELWEQLSEDARDLWEITLRNRKLPATLCPFSVILW